MENMKERRVFGIENGLHRPGYQNSFQRGFKNVDRRCVWSENLIIGLQGVNIGPLRAISAFGNSFFPTKLMERPSFRTGLQKHSFWRKLNVLFDQE